MNRIRLAASAVAASSLGSLGLVGVGAGVAHAAPLVPNTAYDGTGFDTCTAPSDAQMDDWYAHSPYHGVGVYIGGPSFPASCHGGFTADWVQHQAATGWGMWALFAGTTGVQLAGKDPVAQGQADALQAVANAHAVGFGDGTVIFEDEEPYDTAATSAAVVSYLSSFAQTLADSASDPYHYRLGVYGGVRDPAVGPSPIMDVANDAALRGQVAAVDFASWTAEQANFHGTTNNALIPSTLWTGHQRIHQYFGDVTETYGTTTLHIDADRVDLGPAANPPAALAGPADRIAGDTRDLTAVATSKELWANAPATRGDYYNGAAPAARAAVVARSDTFADALGGSALAAHVGGPLLLTPSASLDPDTAHELTRALAPGSTVYVLGGDVALSPTVEQQIRDLGFTTVRLKGDTRFGTAVAIAQQMASDMRDTTGAPAVQRVLLATGVNIPADALAAGAAAGATPDTVLLLTNDAALPTETASYLGQISATTSGPTSATVYAVGGKAKTAATQLRIPAANISPVNLAGTTRFDTATLVARQFFSSTGTPHTLGFATGYNFPDALSGGAAMATLDGPLLLVATDSVTTETQAYLNQLLPTGSVDSGHVFGGTGVVNNGVLAVLAHEVHG